MVIVFILFLAVSITFGTVLTFWHRKLMVRLRVIYPDVWERLGGSGFRSRFWRLSERYPIWSWKSILFFISKHYEVIRDDEFRTEAGRFRVAWLSWFIALCIGSAIALYWDSR